MQAISLLEESQDFILFKMDKKMLQKEHFFMLLKRLELELLIEKADFKENDLEDISKELKKGWWEENKGWFLEKTEISEA